MEYQKGMNFDNLTVYHSNIWSVLLTAWVSLFVIMWIYARNHLMIVILSLLVTFGIFYYIRENHIEYDQLNTLPVYSILVIWFIVLIILISYVEKYEDNKNPDERPETDSIWSMIKYRLSLISKNNMLWTYILIWFCVLMVITVILMQLPSEFIERYFGEPKGGRLPGWMFMISVWWMLFMLINMAPEAKWNKRNVFIGILMALGLFGIWSAKVIPDGMKDTKPGSMRSVMYFVVLFILLFSMVWFIMNTSFLKLN